MENPLCPAIANLIRENKTYRIDSAIQTGAKYDMQLMDDHLWSLYRKKIIDRDEMIDHARRPSDLAKKADDAARALLSQQQPGQQQQPKTVATAGSPVRTK